MSASHADRRHHKSENDELSSTASSDNASPASTDTADSEREEEEFKRRRRRPHKKRRSSSEDSSTTWIMVLGLLIIIMATIAAYYYVEKEGGGLTKFFRNDGTAAGQAASSTSLTKGTEGSGKLSEAEEDSSHRPSSTSSAKTSGESSSSGAGKSTPTTSIDSVQQTEAAQGSEKPISAFSESSSSSSASADPSPSPAAASFGTSTGSAASSANSLRCRKGVGYNKAALTEQLDICWAYNWDSSGGGLKDGVMYIPMLWGAKKLEGWEAAADTAIKNGATHILGFNEPDLSEQANLSPSAAASLWSSAMEPLATKNVKLVSPAVSNGILTDDGKPMGVPWMTEFLEVCKGCSIDAIALHWYDKTSNLEYFQKYIEEAHTKLSKPIWLTEFMGTGSANDQASFISSSVEWLEKQDYVEAYAAFGDFCDNPIANFVDCTGKPNDLGSAYSSSK
ncbi:hypothetical protein JCM5350_000156 [Sporobolomyces pararoseus]